TEAPLPKEAALPGVEKISLPEESREEMPEEQDSGTVGKALSGLKSMLKSQKPATPAVLSVRDALSVRVEKIMEENLAEAYTALPMIKKQEFKIKGEQTAYQIRDLLNKTHVKIKKIFQLLLEWLMLLPGINRFYLEQEAKIKADKIIALKKRDGH
ncbi:MAG: hypothetical protein AAB408_01230, partial [Patescibacteria group bacterium]